jgi:hypothetical protein
VAYMNQEKKKIISAALKPVLNKYGVKGTLKVANHYRIVLTLKSGSIDFVQDMLSEHAREQLSDPIDHHFHVNPYWFQIHYKGKSLEFLTEAIEALKSAGWYDKSDIMTDYFNTAYYFDINVGHYTSPYKVTA